MVHWPGWIRVAVTQSLALCVSASVPFPAKASGPRTFLL